MVMNYRSGFHCSPIGDSSSISGTFRMGRHQEFVPCAETRQVEFDSSQVLPSGVFMQITCEFIGTFV
jgi:hypothetical protein